MHEMRDKARRRPATELFDTPTTKPNPFQGKRRNAMELFN